MSSNKREEELEFFRSMSDQFVIMEEEIFKLRSNTSLEKVKEGVKLLKQRCEYILEEYDEP